MKVNVRVTSDDYAMRAWIVCKGRPIDSTKDVVGPLLLARKFYLPCVPKKGTGRSVSYLACDEGPEPMKLVSILMCSRFE